MEQPLQSQFLASNSSTRDPDIVELSQSATWTAGQSKRERNPVIPHEVIELDGEDDTDGVLATAKFDDKNLPTGVESPEPRLKNPAAEEPKKNKKIIVEDEIDVNYKSFKQFDTVGEHSDHYVSRPEFLKIAEFFKNINPSKDWAKRIQHEWKILEKHLPETIYVRVYEDRMDIMRAVIIGSAGTPYHDGLFFFDVYFAPVYPLIPPVVYYHSGGLRLNPNLYKSGKVCLSLLNTWSGTGCEKWNPSNSTMLQVLVSIQALVLNAKPYFNEPGYEVTANTVYGNRKSVTYNEDTFLLSCKTMLYSLRKPPMHFGDFVVGHFRNRGRTILVSCKAYMDGAQVGCVVGEGVQDVNEGGKSCSASFKSSLKKLFEDLLTEFSVKGADCDEFLVQKDTTPRSKIETFCDAHRCSLTSSFMFFFAFFFSRILTQRKRSSTFLA